MNKTALSSLLALVTVASVPAAAMAQNCPPGSVFCAGVSVNSGISVGGSIQIGGVPQPPPQPVYVQAPPPPPIVYAPPPPPTVVYTQPTYVVQQPQYVVQQPTTYTYTTTTTQTYSLLGSRNQAFGIGVFGSGMGFGHARGEGGAGMGGLGGTMRFRYHPYFATELTAAFYAGRDYNGDTRTEVPVTLNELIYFNPQNRLQVYGLLGLGMSWAGVQYEGTTSHLGRDTGSYTYLGGQVGLGLEWQLTRNFSLFTDVRGFLRTRVDPEIQSNPEFSRSVGGATQTTNTSMGLSGQLGAAFYF